MDSALSTWILLKEYLCTFFLCRLVSLYVYVCLPVCLFCVSKSILNTYSEKMSFDIFSVEYFYGLDYFMDFRGNIFNMSKMLSFL